MRISQIDSTINWLCLEFGIDMAILTPSCSYCIYNRWCQNHRQKTILLGSKILINSVNIEQDSFTTFLGVIINEHLTWSNHISAIIAKISINLVVIRRVSRVLPSEVLYSLYHTLISPSLDYCNNVWELYNSTFLQKMI